MERTLNVIVTSPMRVGSTWLCEILGDICGTGYSFLGGADSRAKVPEGTETVVVSMVRTGREEGDGDNTEFKRKGVVGDGRRYR